MATPDPNLPRGTLVKVEIKGTLKEILLGPSHLTDGTMNLVELYGLQWVLQAQKLSGRCRKWKLSVAPSIWTEGKFLQRTQGVGMGK